MTYKKRKYQHIKLIQLSKELQHKILYSLIVKGNHTFSSRAASMAVTKNLRLKNRLKTISSLNKAIFL
jgi:hypothetical protein